MAGSTAPYGSWVSPISSDVVIKESRSLMEVRIDPFQEGKRVIEASMAVLTRAIFVLSVLSR